MGEETPETVEVEDTAAEDFAVEDAIREAESAPEYSLLKVWSETLDNIESVRSEPIPMAVAGRVVAAWPKLTFQDTATYHEIYHEYLLEIRNILRDVIQDNPGCTDFEGAEDAEENRELYRELVIAWNVLLDSHELHWRAEDADSHIRYAALVEARRLLFSRDGLAGHMEARGITFLSDDIYEAVQTAREEQGE